MRFRSVALGGVALFALTAIALPASAMQIEVDTSSRAGQDATLSITLLDGDFAPNNQAVISHLKTDGMFNAFTCGNGCLDVPPFTLDDGAGFGEFLQDIKLGTFLSFDLSFTSAFNNAPNATSDLVIGELLDAGHFAIFDTNLDSVSAPVPFQDALFVADLASGQIAAAANLTSVPAPAGIALLATGLAMMFRRRSGAFTNSQRA